MVKSVEFYLWIVSFIYDFLASITRSEYGRDMAWYTVEYKKVFFYTFVSIDM